MQAAGARKRADECQTARWSGYFLHAGRAVALGGATSASTTAAEVLVPAITTLGALNAVVTAAAAMGLPDTGSGATV